MRWLALHQLVVIRLADPVAIGFVVADRRLETANVDPYDSLI